MFNLLVLLVVPLHAVVQLQAFAESL